MGVPQYKYDFKTVTEAAHGHWASIVTALSTVNYDWDRAISKVDKRSKAGNPCPVNGGKDGFRLFLDFHETGGAFSQQAGAFANGFQLLAWVNNAQIGRVLRDVGEFLQLDPSERKTAAKKQTTARPSTRRKVEAVDMKAIKRIQKVWSESELITKGSPAEKYLGFRGIELETFPDCMRMHPNLPYYGEDDQHNVVEKGRFPALVMNVTNEEDKTVSLHRIYLTEDGYKATVDGETSTDVKKMMTPYKPNGTTGAAIKFFEPEDGMLALAEGPETALAVHMATGLPVWSCVNAYLLGQVILPADVKHVLIYADKDQTGTGQNAAIELHERLMLAGIYAAIRLPKATIPRGHKSVDWQDIWADLGKEGFLR